MGDHSGVPPDETLTRESPQLVAVLKEMTAGLVVVRSKVQTLTERVKEKQFSTADGMSYLEAKNLLLLSYCQSIVYYMLRKAKGLPIKNHPVVSTLIEIRLFLEKIRPIDKKLEYQVRKLTHAASNVAPVETDVGGKEKNAASEDEDDDLKYRPNPEMLLPRKDRDAGTSGGIYRPPRIAPASMDEDRVSKQEKQALRKEKFLLQQAKQSSYVKELIDELDDRPEEIREDIAIESRELSRYKAKWEDRAKQEEDLFIRAPITKEDKRIEKRMRKSRDGVLGLADGFFDGIGALPLEEEVKNDNMTSYTNTSSARKRFKRHK